MGHVLEQERSLRHVLDAGKEKVPLRWTGKKSLFDEKPKVGHSFGQPYLDPTNSESRQSIRAEKIAQSNYSVNDRKSRVEVRACDDKELVKHMSNLPGFLQQVEKDSSIQGKALNFGVLDWKRLEKWKYTERMPVKQPKKAPSSSSSAIGPPKIDTKLRKQPSSYGSNNNSSLLYSGKQPIPHGMRFSSPQRQPPPPQSSLFNLSKEERDVSYHIKWKGKETCDQRYPDSEKIRIGPQKESFHRKINFQADICPVTDVRDSERKDANIEVKSEKEASSSNRSKHKPPLPSHNKIHTKEKKKEIMSENEGPASDRGKPKTHVSSQKNKMNAFEKKSEMRYDEVNVASDSPADPQNIVLLVPKDFSKRRFSESSQFAESRTSIDRQFPDVPVSRLSDFVSPQDLYSGELIADIPHSCPLPSGAFEVHDDLVTSQPTELDICPSTCASADSFSSIASESKCSVTHEETSTPTSVLKARKQDDIDEHITLKGRAPSPTRRFSFNLGRMSRNSRFKESSTVPQMSSTYTSVKSDPVTHEASSGVDNSKREIQRKSSPLRRLLDPILKYKGAQSSETIRTPNGSLHPATVRPTSTNGSSQDRKTGVSTFQALLQLTMKNSLPFFKLVVDNSNDMLAAAVKILPASGKSDPCMVYAFYSVHEIRKKSMTWINQGSKSKGCSLGYNIVGQMRVSNSHHLKLHNGDSNECDVRECVLYGADTAAQGDQQTIEFLPKKEIAAIIVKSSSKNVPAVTCGTEDNKNSKGAVVILPGGVHGVPIKGAPSSLISRWKSGGLCDCGGWDVGCKLRILADCEKSSNVLQASTSTSDFDHVNLFLQGGDQKSKPVFSLKPFSNGFYSIEFDTSISFLEAFGTCVAYVTCSKFPEMLDAKGMLDSECLPEATMGTDKRKAPATFQEPIPAKYVTCPPLSPVGRI